MRRQRNPFKKFLLILIAVLLLLLALNYLLNQNMKIDALIKRSNEQTTHINKLEADVSRLENNIAYEDKQIQSLSHNKATVVQKEKDIKETQVIDTPSLMPQTIIVSVLVTLGGLLKTLVPAL